VPIDLHEVELLGPQRPRQAAARCQRERSGEAGVSAAQGADGLAIRGA
jgi:hypothetical protein